MQRSSISWTDFTSNPIKYRDKRTRQVVWACVKHSPGCLNCYSEALATRYRKGSPFTRHELEHVEPFLDETELKELMNSKKIAGKRVFVGDMTDCFGEWVPDSMLDRMIEAFSIRQDVTFQLLTKRSDRMANYMGKYYCSGLAAEAAIYNTHLGFSAENQEWFDKRAQQMAPLMRLGWTVYCSAEPLLSRIVMHGTIGNVLNSWLGESGIRQVIMGGESGVKRRPMEREGFADLVRQCKDAGAAAFVKQDSAFKPGMQGRIPLDVWNVKE